MTGVLELRPGHPAYPGRLGPRGPVLYARGELGLFRLRVLGVVASVKATGSAILQALAWARSFADDGCVVISGFHSPLEQECLALFLKREIPVIACPAREIASYRLPAGWQGAIEAARMLVLSPFRAQRRITAQTSVTRNALIAALADEFIVLHASRGGATERLAAKVMATGKRVRDVNGRAFVRPA